MGEEGEGLGEEGGLGEEARGWGRRRKGKVEGGKCMLLEQSHG